MDQIDWCMKQDRGIELIEPNDNLQRAYILKAEEALETLQTTKSRDWQLTTAYYTIYHGVYSLLMKIGVKCEIHTCTIEFAKRFLFAYLSNEDFELFETAFRARNDAQYYVNRFIPDENYLLIMEKTPIFLVRCKNIRLSEQEILRIRSAMKTLL